MAAFGDSLVDVPCVVTGQVEMLPSERGGVLEMRRIQLSCLGQLLRCTFKIDGVPKGDRSDDQVEAAGSVALVLEGPVADLAEAIEEHGTSE
jgi:hypothetical protein